jgi:hypothetical protein
MTSFDLNQNPDTNQQIKHVYPTMTASSISLVTDSGTKFIKANFNGGGSTPNVVYTKSNTTVNFKATQLFVYGNVHSRNGISYAGELIIKNDPLTNASSTPSIYMCFILSNNSNNLETGIDKIINDAEKNKEKTPISVDLNTGGEGESTYIVYKAANNSGIPCLVVLFTTPIQIKSNLSGFSNNCDSLFVTPNNNLTYSIVSSKIEGDWMECDYVPIESAAVTTYSLPIQSSLIKDSNSMDSLRTTIMFVTFFIICVLAYFLIPTIYLAILSKLIKDDNASVKMSPVKKKKIVLYMDYVLSFVFGGTGLILICVGAFSDPTKVENTGDILLTGFAFSIIYIISYIIIQARKLGGGTFIPDVNYVKAAPAQEEGGQPA